MLGGLVTLALPWLHAWMPASLLLLMFGGAWGGAVVAAASLLDSWDPKVGPREQPEQR